MNPTEPAPHTELCLAVRAALIAHVVPPESHTCSGCPCHADATPAALTSAHKALVTSVLLRHSHMLNSIRTTAPADASPEHMMQLEHDIAAVGAALGLMVEL